MPMGIDPVFFRLGLGGEIVCHYSYIPRMRDNNHHVAVKVVVTRACRDDCHHKLAGHARKMYVIACHV